MPRLSLAKLERHLYAAADRLRQEGLDAATYKDYIFGMLFLKRCSDVFYAENEKLIGGKVAQGMAKDEATRIYGENPDYYDEFFVPERARWTYLQSRLNDADEEELAAWNYAKDLERQMRELKADNKARARLEKQAAKSSRTCSSRRVSVHSNPGGGSQSGLTSAATDEGVAARRDLQPVRERLAALEAALQPYEYIKQQLAEARARYRTLTDDFVNELKSRCGALNDDQKRALVLELFAQDVHAGLDAAVAEKRQQLVRFLEGLWDKYRVTLEELRSDRAQVETQLETFLIKLGYR